MRFVAAVLVLAATTAACSDDDSASGDSARSDPSEAPSEVAMELVAYKPERLEVKAGTSVTWSQRDPGAHTVTSGTVEQGGAGVTPEPDELFDSGSLSTDDTFEHTFEEPGTYPYFCSLHPATMRGEIVVT